MTLKYRAYTLSEYSTEARGRQFNMDAFGIRKAWGITANTRRRYAGEITVIVVGMTGPCASSTARIVCRPGVQESGT